MDILYIVKQQEFNPDLMYSLRTVAANVTGYNKIYIAGYKPRWVSSKVNAIPITQNLKSKWLNARKNIYHACRNKYLSDDFVLFNDDFFAINKVNLETDINLRNGSIERLVQKYKDKEDLSWWESVFSITKDILLQAHSTHFDNFELHLPIVYNKRKFREMIEDPVVGPLITKYQRIATRSLYKNLNYPEIEPTDQKDVKLNIGKDMTEEMKSNQWISVYDDVTDNLDKFPVLKSVLESFPPCQFERKVKM